VRDHDCGDNLPRFCVLMSREGYSSPVISDGGAALSGVLGAIGCDTDDVLMGENLGQQFGQHEGIPDTVAGDLSLILISSVCSSTTRSTLRQARLFAQVYLRARRSPPKSHSIVKLSMSKCSGPCAPRYGILTARLF
jgi:hypothetical protein